MEKRLMNNIGLKILAFFVAFMLWIMVVNIDDPVTHKTFSDIPVSVINEEVLANAHQPQTYQIVDNTQTVDVTVTAKRGKTRLCSSMPVLVRVLHHQPRQLL